MRIFNETKTIELQNPDLEKGYLADDRIQIGQTAEVAEVREQGHYEVEREYPNGGKDMRWVVDVPRVAPQPSEPIFENIKVYFPYSAAESKVRAEEKFYQLHKLQIDELNRLLEYLCSTDYKAIQYAEGVLAATEFEPVKQQRQQVRTQVRNLQLFIANERISAGLGES